jgi:hypothetical protein
LQQLLEAVMDGRVINEKAPLNDFVTKFIKISDYLVKKHCHLKIAGIECSS